MTGEAPDSGQAASSRGSTYGFRRAVSFPAEPPLVEEPEATDEQVLIDAAWDSQNLLTLDGGGIRGYWSLLALEKLMQSIGRLEQSLGTPASHSFFPEERPRYFTQVERIGSEPPQQVNDDPGAALTEGEFRSLRASRRYLPCHYFDYIGGSSTGGLIAILLGTLRMTVLDCIREYETLGQKVFGKPRLFIQLHFGVGKRVKYDSNKLKAVFKDVTKQRDKRNAKTFKCERHVCRTFVTSIRREPEKPGSYPFLIRSYPFRVQVEPGGRPGQQGTRSQTLDPTSSARLSLTASVQQSEVREAQNFKVHEVARAATAAPFYFKAIRLRNGDEAEMEYTDGGFGLANNPTMEGIKDIQAMHSGPLGAVVSVGTARHPAEQNEEWWIATKLRGLFDGMNDPTQIHEEVKVKARTEQFPYYRLNPENDQHLLTMPLDAWSPKRWQSKSPGWKTLDEIRGKFSKWYSEGKCFCPLTGREQSVPQMFDQLATKLVRQRKLRAQDPSKWKAYAHCATYNCNLDRCGDRKWTNYGMFKEHCEKDHHKTGQALEDAIAKATSMWEYPRIYTRQTRQGTNLSQRRS